MNASYHKWDVYLTVLHWCIIKYFSKYESTVKLTSDIIQQNIKYPCLATYFGLLLLLTDLDKKKSSHDITS